MTEHVRLAVYPDGTVSWGEGGVRYSYLLSKSRILTFVDEKGQYQTATTCPSCLSFSVSKQAGQHRSILVLHLWLLSQTI